MTLPPLAKSSHQEITDAHRSLAPQASLLKGQNRAGMLREGRRGAGAIPVPLRLRLRAGSRITLPWGIRIMNPYKNQEEYWHWSDFFVSRNDEIGMLEIFREEG